MTRVAVIVVALACSAAQADDRPWAIGAQLGAFDSPIGHLGAPVQGTLVGYHLPVALSARYELSDAMAIDAGFGIAQSGMGPAIWAGHELYRRITDGRVPLDIYESAGLQLGFAGPDYYARRDGEFVGLGYAFAGPLAFAVRLPAGVRARWAHDRVDTYVEVLNVVALTPSVEYLFELTVGARYHF